jgi:hypothetical protein
MGSDVTFCHCRCTAAQLPALPVVPDRFAQHFLKVVRVDVKQFTAPCQHGIEVGAREMTCSYSHLSL